MGGIHGFCYDSSPAIKSGSGDYYVDDGPAWLENSKLETDMVITAVKACTNTDGVLLGISF
jgi:hypothetical protein